jgi:hypothetical protein
LRDKFSEQGTLHIEGQDRSHNWEMMRYEREIGLALDLSHALFKNVFLLQSQLTQAVTELGQVFWGQAIEQSSEAHNKAVG